MLGRYIISKCARLNQWNIAIANIYIWLISYHAFIGLQCTLNHSTIELSCARETLLSKYDYDEAFAQTLCVNKANKRDPNPFLVVSHKECKSECTRQLHWQFPLYNDSAAGAPISRSTNSSCLLFDATYCYWSHGVRYSCRKYV